MVFAFPFTDFCRFAGGSASIVRRDGSDGAVVVEVETRC